MPETKSSPSQRFCAHCGAALRPEARFCATCGAAVTGAPGPAAHPATLPARTRPGGNAWLLVIGALLLVAAAAAFFSSRNAQTPVASVPMSATATAVPADLPYPAVRRIPVEEAHVAVMSGDAVLVDVRDKEYYEAGHAARAISIPLAELPARMNELPRDNQILLYCT